MSAMRPPGKLDGPLLSLGCGRGSTIFALCAVGLPLIDSVNSPQQPRLVAPTLRRIAGIADEDRMP